MTDTATLLPPNAAPLERAVAVTAAHLSAIPTPLRDLWQPSACPSPQLPWLAYAYAVEEWDTAWTDATKREVIQQALPVKQIKGTYGSVQSALTAMGLPCRVREWYQQSPAGAPYTFRLAIEADQVGFNADQLARIGSVVGRYKNTRSHLDGIDITVRSVDGFKPASAALSGTDSTVRDGTPAYTDGVSALDLLVDGAVNGYTATAAAADQVSDIVASMPTLFAIPSDL